MYRTYTHLVLGVDAQCFLFCFVFSIFTPLRGAGDDMEPFQCTLSQHQGHKIHDNM